MPPAGSWAKFAGVISAAHFKLTRAWPLLIAAGMLVSCDSPQKRALRELTKAGIEPSGGALLQAVIERDALRTGWLVVIPSD